MIVSFNELNTLMELSAPSVSCKSPNPLSESGAVNAMWHTSCRVQHLSLMYQHTLLQHFPHAFQSIHAHVRRSYLAACTSCVKLCMQATSNMQQIQWGPPLSQRQGRSAEPEQAGVHAYLAGGGSLMRISRQELLQGRL